MGLLTSLGVDWVTLVSQLINFTILYLILKKFALDKIIAAMHKRQEEISQGIKNAHTASLALEQAKTQQDEILTDAHQEARKIISEAKTLAKAVESKMLAEAKTQAQEIVATGHKQIEVEKEKMMLAVRSELAEIVALGVERVIGEKVPVTDVRQHFLEVGFKA
jgi:F-type H+-transporting ATPase subunit b